MSKKAKLTIDEKEALEEQQKKTDYWKGRTQELKGKMIEERQMWEHKYETTTGKQSQDIAGLKFKLRAKKIEQVELSQSFQNTIQSMEQSLKEHKDYIILLREQDVSKTVEYERLLGELRRDNEDWKAQCMARQLYIKHETKKLFKAVDKAHEMWDKAEALLKSSSPQERTDNNC